MSLLRAALAVSRDLGIRPLVVRVLSQRDPVSDLNPMRLNPDRNGVRFPRGS